MANLFNLYSVNFAHMSSVKVNNPLNIKTVHVKPHLWLFRTPGNRWHVSKMELFKAQIAVHKVNTFGLLT
jgi:hypothetical protein